MYLFLIFLITVKYLVQRSGLYLHRFITKHVNPTMGLGREKLNKQTTRYTPYTS